MYIKSITIKGFKSFAEKLKLQIEPGMIAIVGPNGSGKSNIVDAILWVLGEQSARLLRGDSMEDVIFAGSIVHKALGMAEVTLVLDNSDGMLPVEYSEVNISRRLFRSGESHYLLNGRQSKLNEIKELLSEAALGKGIYSIISQGRIDEILSSKPEERRLFVDEAAGVLKHRLRREKTHRKLKGLDEKILRLNDIYSEISRQIKPLEKQAEDAQKYSDARDRLSKLETELIARQIIKLKSRWDKVIKTEEGFSGQKEIINNKLTENNKQLSQLIDRISRAREEQSQISKHREKVLVLNEHFNSLKERIKQAIDITDQKIAMVATSLTELQKPEEQFMLFDRDYLNSLEKELADVSGLIAMQTIAQGDQKQAVSNLEADEKDIKVLIEQLNLQLQEALMESSAISAGLIDERIEDARTAKSNTVDELEQIDKQLKDLDTVYGLDSSTFESLTTERGSLFESLQSLQKDKQAADLRSDELRNRLTAKRSELQTLEGMFRNRIKDLPASQVSNLAVDLVKFPGQYEDHVINIFEQEIEGLLVKNAEQIPELLESGYALSLLELMAGNRKIPENNVRCLADMSTGKHTAFLSNIYIADSLETAVKCQAKYMGMNLYFIFEDKIFTPYGSVRFVHSKKESAFLLKKQMLVLEGEVGHISVDLQHLETEQKALIVKIGDVEEGLGSADAKIDSKKTRMRESEVMIQSLGIQKDKLANIKEQYDLKLAKLCEEKELLGQKAARLTAVIESKNSEKADLWLKLETIEKEIVVRKTVLTEALTKMSELKLKEATISNEIEQIKSNFSKSQEIEARKLQKIEDLTGKRAALTGNAVDLGKLLTITVKIAGYAEGAARHALDEKNMLDKRLTEFEFSRSDLQAATESLKESMHTIEMDVNGIEIQKTEIKIKLADLKLKLEEELQCDVDEAIAMVSSEVTTSELQEEQRQARMILARIGPVNLIAVDELAALREREELYRTQIDDLIESKSSLMDIIKELDILIIGTFGEFFEKLSDNFQSMVESFFPGGSGKLSLTDIDDVLNCGIDIEIKASAGKKFQTLTLLSGGERAMSALAFMFSLLLTRPAPFCIMDEVDAALDDFNINKLVNFLIKMKTNSQLVLITHQKRTMEAADIIFGVSMQPDGTSKVLSQKIEVFA